MAEEVKKEKKSLKQRMMESIDEHPVAFAILGGAASVSLIGVVNALVQAPKGIIESIRRPADSYYNAAQLRAIHGREEPDTYNTYNTTNEYVTKEPDLVLYKAGDDKSDKKT